MKIATIIARLLLGLVFAVFGANVFLQFMRPPPIHGAGGAFVDAMVATHYMSVVAVCQFAGGLLLLYGRYVALGLTILGPVVVNILCFHVFMDRSGLPIAIVVFGVWVFLLWCYRAPFAGLVKP